MSGFPNLRQQYLGMAVQDTYDAAKEAAKEVSNRAFGNIFGEKPAELPPPRTVPEPPEGYQPPTAPPPPPYNPVHDHPQNYPGYYPYPQSPQSQFGLPAYMPPPPPPRYKVDEDKMRSMAKWKATLNLKYVETGSNFARTLVGSLAATNAVVELVSRFDRNDATLTEDEKALIPTMRKAVEKRRSIEQAKTKILSDDDMRSIYEELIFQDMWDKNERGELRLEDPNDFLRNYMILTGAEILESGKDVIIDKVTGVAGNLKNKLSKKK